METIERVIPRESLYETLKKVCDDKYSIGFHAINYFRFPEEERKQKVADIKNSILSDGLQIRSGRPLMGTVAFTGFGSVNEESFINYYTYGDVNEYVIVGLPRVLKNEKGEEIFLGHPVYKKDIYDEDSEFLVERDMGTQGRTISCMADAFLPDYTPNVSTLDPMFILGTFTKIDSDNIRLNINPNHICFKGDIVPSDYFDRKKRNIDAYLNDSKGDLCYLPSFIGPAIENTKEQLQKSKTK